MKERKVTWMVLKNKIKSPMNFILNGFNIRKLNEFGLFYAGFNSGKMLISFGLSKGRTRPRYPY